jgi:hypothetical protein
MGNLQILHLIFCNYSDLKKKIIPLTLSEIEANYIIRLVSFREVNKLFFKRYFLKYFPSLKGI